jgi:Protein of unknown function (DUF1565)
MRINLTTLLTALLLIVAHSAIASSTWYVDVNGNDDNNCKSLQSPCQTIGRAIVLASSDDSIRVAAGIYAENLTISFNLNLRGAGASTTAINGGGPKEWLQFHRARGSLFTKLAIRNGTAKYGGGIYNAGRLTINETIVSANLAKGEAPRGGGMANDGTLTIDHSVISGNRTSFGGFGAGIFAEEETRT